MVQQISKYAVIILIVILSMHLCSQQPLPSGNSAAEPLSKSPFTNTVYKAPTIPAAATFAGEQVPLQIPDVAERFDRELLSNSYYHSGTLIGLKRMQRYLPKIKQLLRENDIPEDFIYLALAESLFSQAVSPAGAAGFWQLMPDTARGYGMLVNDEVDERFHVEKATLAACRYLKAAKNKFGSWTNAAASYNRGMGGLDRALKQQGVSSYYDLYLNDETSRYMFRILALKEILGNPQRYGFHLPAEQGYKPLPTRPLIIKATIPDLPQFALDNGINYKLLRLYNPWIKGYKLTVAPGKEFVLQMPV